MFQIPEEKFYKFQRVTSIQIKSFYKFQTNFKAKTEKKGKRKRRKAEKATGKQTGPAREGARGPLTTPSRIITAPPSSSH
jgi:hypothetical protein